jgi:hypothetical protein
LNVTGENYAAIFYIPYTEGNIQIGNNTVWKIDGTIYINS